MDQRNSFFRLQATVIDSEARIKLGVFQAAYDLSRGNRIDDDDKTSLDKILVWFERNLILPDRAKLVSGAIFWYKSASRAMTQKTWELGVILKRYDAVVEFIRTRKPGYIVYEDDQQIAAIPFRDTFRD